MNRALLIAAGLALIGPGCARDELSGPPTLHLGRDECALCGMILSEDRFSSALLVAEGDSPTHLLFDDVGCMLDYRAERSDLAIIDAFVHDYDSRGWLPVGRASFVMSLRGELATPMGSGIAAFETANTAAGQARNWNGTVLGYDGLANARREWKEARRASEAP